MPLLQLDHFKSIPRKAWKKFFSPSFLSYQDGVSWRLCASKTRKWRFQTICCHRSLLCQLWLCGCRILAEMWLLSWKVVRLKPDQPYWWLRPCGKVSYLLFRLHRHSHECINSWQLCQLTMLDKTDNPQAKSNSMIEWSTFISKGAIHSLEIPSHLYNSLELRRMKLCQFIQNGTSHIG